MRNTRGQTTLDFAIGISIFLTVLLFAFAFVPGFLQPFAGGGADDPALAGRLADKLAEGQLGTPAEPNVLDRHCTVAFFDSLGASPPGECRYEGTSFEERISVSDRTNVNVTFEGNVTATSSGPAVLCWDQSDHDLTESGLSGCDVELIAGDTPPANTDTTVTTRRVVSLHDEVVTLKVVVW